jgi:hypothetical protein
LVEILNVHVKPEELRPSRNTVGITDEDKLGIYIPVLMIN